MRSSLGAVSESNHRHINWVLAVDPVDIFTAAMVRGLVSFALAKILAFVYLIVGIVTVAVSALSYAGFDWAAVVAWALPAYFGLAVFLILPAHIVISGLVCAWCLLFTVGLWKGWRPVIYFMLPSYCVSMGVPFLFSDLLTGIVQCIIAGVLFFLIIAVRNKFVDEGTL